ncbi:MAG: ABC transporter substrate-binding protein [Candidatus Fermentibacter sp.]|nr:ABC transporter substrate-binding protein [Candidatus Fermentibacter sp.]
MTNRRMITLALAAALCTGCGRERPEGTLRVGYFPNITHSQAIIGLARGDFARETGPGIVIEPIVFNAGPSVIEALYAGEIDLAYIGPNPAVNGYIRSDGAALRVVAGATSAGACLVVRSDEGISTPADLDGRTLASPQLGNTQDVALRCWLMDNGLSTLEQGGTVEVVAVQNPDIFDLFVQGQIDGAWVPEPWASRLVVEGGGTVLVDERDLWEGGRFPTACVIASTRILDENPELVEAWLRAHVSITRWELANPDSAMALVNSEIGRMTGKALPDSVMAMAWSRMTPTWDPLPECIVQSAEAAFRIGYLDEEPDLSGLCDLTILGRIAEAGR